MKNEYILTDPITLEKKDLQETEWSYQAKTMATNSIQFNSYNFVWDTIVTKYCEHNRSVDWVERLFEIDKCLIF